MSGEKFWTHFFLPLKLFIGFLAIRVLIRNRSRDVKKMNLKVFAIVATDDGFNLLMHNVSYTLPHPVPDISENCTKMKINLIFHFRTFLWCLK